MRRFAILVPVLLMTAAADIEPRPRLVIVVHQSNPVDDLSRGQVRKMLLGQVRYWPDQTRLTLVVRDAASPAFHAMLTSVLRMTEAEYHRQWMSVEFRGETAPPLKVLNSAESACRFVTYVPGAVALVESEALAGASMPVKVVRIDGKLPDDPGYNMQ